MKAGRVRWLAVCGAVWVCWLASGGVIRLAAQARTSRTSKAETANDPQRFGIGRPATPAEIAAVDIDVRPDGAGLPPGSGTSADGATIYAARCSACHGKTGKEGPEDALVGRDPREGFPFGRDVRLTKTIGNYWPYATTLFDYIRRAMPADAPGSLKNDEVYALVAYLLVLNEVIPADAVVDAASLPKIAMPAHDRFVPAARGGPNSTTRTGGRR